MNPSYPIQSYYVPRQAYKPYSSHLAFNGSALQMQPLDGQVTTGQSYISHSFDPPPGLHTSTPHDAESSSDTQVIPAIPIGPPTKPQKRKAPTLRANIWEPYKARIIKLYITEKRPLPEVKKKIQEEFGFTTEYVSSIRLSKVDL